MATRKAKPARKRTGWSVASAAGGLLEAIKRGGKLLLVTKSGTLDSTSRVERICASALGQAESAGRRKRK